jgi:hypothetical protein
MMILLLAALYALLLPLGFGVLLLQLIRRSLKHYLTDAPVSVLTYWLGGTALLTALLECWSFAGPIHTAAHVAAAGMGLLGMLQPEGRQLLRGIGASVGRLHIGIQLLGVLLTLCAFMLSTLPPFNVDTAIYHAQALRWLEEVGIVPGLANVDIHLGFNSAWFVPEALFSWGRYWGSPLQVLNSVFFVLFGWYGLGGLNRLVRGQGQPVDVLKALLVIMMTFWLADDLPSLSPDPAATLIVFGIITQALALPLPAGRPLSVAHAALLLIIRHPQALYFACVAAGPLVAGPFPAVPQWPFPGHNGHVGGLRGPAVVRKELCYQRLPRIPFYGFWLYAPRLAVSGAGIKPAQHLYP